ncbi:MAG: CinA family protein [Actinomycetales bacterium]|nr:CinA family protein [Actinomycetales bacterium]
MSGGPTAEAAAAVRLLVAAGRTVAVAESLTGGAVTSALVDVPGASACLRGGVVAYATDVKERLLGVPADLLAGGAVDPEVARAMARGVRAALAADVGVATTGVAGPDPADGRPVGEFHVAVVGPDSELVRSVRPEAGAAPPGREAVRRAARDAALALLVGALARP